MVMQRQFMLVITTLSTIYILGCASQKAWVYQPEPLRNVSALSSKNAVVLPFEDLREDLNTNMIFFYLIPLVPFGWQDFNVPEGAQMRMNSGLWINYKPTEDFAKALATELQNARTFKES